MRIAEVQFSTLLDLHPRTDRKPCPVVVMQPYGTAAPALDWALVICGASPQGPVIIQFVVNANGIAPRIVKIKDQTIAQGAIGGIHDVDSVYFIPSRIGRIGQKFPLVIQFLSKTQRK